MASGLLTLLDDITVVLDDVAAMSKIAAKKTAGLIGDDLAVNANVVVGLDPKRELPIIGKIALGSLGNKIILIPLALALPAKVIGPVLMLGGAFLCYEALHKIFHRKEKKSSTQEVMLTEPLSPPQLKAMENEKVRGAIGTDTILSAEVLAVALGAVSTAPLLTKALSLAVIGLAMTVGVYGLVALIVKADDVGFKLRTSTNPALRGLGTLLVKGMPHFMRLLSFAGTLAMLLVGGGILLHGIPALAHAVEPFGLVIGTVANLIAGILFGLLAYPLFSGMTKLIQSWKGNSSEVPAAA